MDPYVNWAVTILSLSAIVGGSLLQSVFLMFDSFLFVLPFALKILTISVVALGFLVSFFI